MTLQLRVFLLIPLVMSLGCGSQPPLPPEGPPADFLCVYTWEEPDPGSAAGSSDPSPAGTPPGKIRVALDAQARMDVEATYRMPHEKIEKTTQTLRPEQFRTLYDAVLQADLFRMPDEWVGSDKDIGSETWFILGSGRSRSISVVGQTVPALARLRSAVHTYLPSLKATSDETRNAVIMDTRTNTFHAAGDPHVSSIPREYRKEYAHEWAALNDGGQPCPNFESPR